MPSNIQTEGLKDGDTALPDMRKNAEKRGEEKEAGTPQIHHTTTLDTGVKTTTTLSRTRNSLTSLPLLKE
jgi:flagellar basal body rod protein FlgG